MLGNFYKIFQVMQSHCHMKSENGLEIMHANWPILIHETSESTLEP